ncbi:MAG: hypothetical protein AAGA33_08555, partial [Pseudomonadota bacterium]
MANEQLSSQWKLIGALTLLALLALPTFASAQETVVTTNKDENGWQLLVNGEPFYMKGVVWGYTPRGQNYTYNLFGQSDDQIRKVLDYEFGLMAEMGVNSIRTFTKIPPRWVTYIYREHGIMSVINPLMGRYGYLIDGTWVPFTDYSDPRTREILKADMAEWVREYKDVPGVLMFAFGNESNYGLSWSSFEIENLPEGEQNTAKARFLYSLFQEVIAEGKKIAPNYPFTIVNGDIQYIDLIVELMPDLDILGSNVYRGPSFTSLWADVEEKLDLPVAFFEFGSDAFNAREFREDQPAQAMILKAQWQEMYNKAYGHGEEGNSIGAFIFEWRDEWWKYLQIEQLDIQNNNASWSNQAYLFDWAEGKNNMNEEWFGITALGPMNSDGVATARPRMAFDLMQEVFSLDVYGSSKNDINNAFASLNTDFFQLKGDVRRLSADADEAKRKLQFTGGRLDAEMVWQGTEQAITEEGESGVSFGDGQMVFLDFAFEPNEKLQGQFSVNVIANRANKRPLDFTYGDRALPITIFAQTEDDQLGALGGFSALQQVTLNDRERVEIYDFNAEYQGEKFDMEAFYHTPRFHWGFEGDHFGLLRETTDILGSDIWNAKAPEGVEFIGKDEYSGLTFLIGPEVYWGANPKAMLKYDFGFARWDWTFIHSEDFSRQDEGALATQATDRQSRQTTLTAEREFGNGMKLELGGIMSASERIDEVFDRFDNGQVFRDEIELEDTLGLRAKLYFPLLGGESYVSANHSGLVADGGQHHRTFGVFDPSRLPNSGRGNKNEYEAGMIFSLGNWMVMPRVLYRDNLVHANPTVLPEISNGVLSPGVNPRDTDQDPFAVLDNREARSGEIYFTWDPTGATPFYDWDNEWREDAKFAFNIGGTYTSFPTFTDANLFFFEPTGSNASFGRGLPSDDVWAVSSRIVLNPNPNARYIFNLMYGQEQSTGDPGDIDGPDKGAVKYSQFHWKAEWNRRHIFEGYFMKDAFGPFDFYRQFNVTFPEQIKLDYSVRLGVSGILGSLEDERNATRVGIRALYRTADENSPDDEFLDGLNDYTFQTVFYITY